ncbi:MAG: protein translocase subunit SecD [Erysipelotrichales bacterium]|nr:protein translocase subunit SecD [Erysipelotrichales bacterium]MBQ2309306.1 protein translocase subunit SecD [Erysipelotrichales bacterium]MBQ4011598.1 protein translocase subunit SecD [Erysipelotrichales bacterium]MBQ4375253.1 protein translocase subunit SecD [Erysipelotrichales bacterium]
MKTNGNNSGRNPLQLTLFIGIIAAMLILTAVFAKKTVETMNLGLDLQGGFEIAYEVSPLEEGKELPDMTAVVASIQKRINVLGVSEPEITVEGDNQIRVQLAGVKNQDEARSVISSTANLTFRNSKDELLMDASVLKEGGASLAYENGSPIVSLKIADNDTFYKVTSEVAKTSDRLMVVWLDFEEGVDKYEDEYKKQQMGQDPAYISAATVSSGINGDAIIQGNFTEDEARLLANLINSGSLPVKLTEIYSNVVSAELGASAYSKTMAAGGIGILLVMLFMIFRYRFAGVVSAATLPFYVIAVLWIYKMMGGVFTLPGIAALVLGVGMAVDANIITFERLKDELYTGKKLPAAVQASQKTSLAAIIDAQLTTFIAALIMYVFGTGSVKGFATMLMLTLFCTVIINILIVRLLMNRMASSHYFDDNPALFGVKKEMVPDIAKGEKYCYKNPYAKFDFVKHAKKFVIAAGVVAALFLVMLVGRSAAGKEGINLGIDFSSGTRLTIEANETLTEEEINSTFTALGYTPNKIQFMGDKNTGASVILKESLDQETLTGIKASLEEHYGHEVSDSVVTPMVGKTLVRNAIYLTILAWVCMLAYISVRFRWDFAIGAIAALIHDIAMVFAVFVILNFEVNSDLIAVFLAIIGYSINNSIIVFDRIRNELNERHGQKETPAMLKSVVNTALANTFDTSISATVSTVLPVLALLIFGSSSIFTFNFALLVGMLAGTISSLFIAPQVWYRIRINEKPKAKKKKTRKSTELEEYVVPGINDIR